MSEYKNLSKIELEKELNVVKEEYKSLCGLGLNLDMSRGKPGAEDLDLCCNLFLQLSDEKGYKNRDGIDCRNYGGVEGIGEMRDLFSEIIELPANQVIIGGNSSLTMMFDTISQGMTEGLGGTPWILDEKRKFLCPAPGYDRHFAVTQYFGFELIMIPMKDDGPDMDLVEKWVKDESVKGIWCVPKYSNPDGITYSDEVVKRLANLKPKADNFHIIWDNAYVVHDLYDETDNLLNIYDECVKAGNEDMPIIFASTSKISLPGAGVAACGASKAMIEKLLSRIKLQTVGPDKVNMLRHARFLPDLEAVKKLMKQHANVLRPKFDAVLLELQKNVSGKGIARWTNPKGGYFISLYVMDGCAKRVAQLCKEAGLVLTPAGAAYPYGNDPKDSHLRIAPSYPSIEDITTAAKVLAVAVRYAALEKLYKNAL